MDPAKLKEFAERYAEAWCSQDPARVRGSKGALGRHVFDKLDSRPDGTAFHWTLTGKNTGPGGTGKSVRISGYELWQIGPDGRIADSEGHFDAAEYQRQLEHGVDG